MSKFRFYLEMQSALDLYRVLKFAGTDGVRGIDKYDDKSMEVEIDSADEVAFMDLVEEVGGSATIL